MSLSYINSAYMTNGMCRDIHNSLMWTSTITIVRGGKTLQALKAVNLAWNGIPATGVRFEKASAVFVVA